MPRTGKLLLTVNLPKTTRPKTIRPTLRATALHRTSRRRPWTGWSHRSSWPRNPACMWYCSATVSRDISRTPSSSSRTPRPSASYRRKRWCPNSSWIRPVKTTPNTLRCCCHTPPWTKRQRQRFHVRPRGVPWYLAGTGLLPSEGRCGKPFRHLGRQIHGKRLASRGLRCR